MAALSGAAAGIAINAALRSNKKIQLLVDNWAVCSQLRRTIREGTGLWKLASDATNKRLAQGKLVPISRKTTRVEVRATGLHRGSKVPERQGSQGSREGSGPGQGFSAGDG